MPSEQLLQAAWQQQRLLRDQLETLDGKKVKILHPGFKNYEAGPDFHGALVQFDTETPVSGDIEVDLKPAGWRAHGHDRNPEFRDVILQVVWEGEKPVAPDLPVIRLQGRLDAPLAELSLTLNQDSLRVLPENLLGRCSGILRELSPDNLKTLLHAAAEVRFRGKAAQLQSRARQAGWEQALWEGLFRALGYKQNVWPMQSLAEMRPRWGGRLSEPTSCQARLFGVGGLLPSDVSSVPAGTGPYLRGIWDQWWREREEYIDCLLPRELWRFNNLRPANHPQRRLALASHWLASGNLPARLEKWFAKAAGNAGAAESLLEVLQVEKDEFWSWHWTFRTNKLSRPQPLLGSARVTDLAINVILPWLWVRAVEGGNDKLQSAAEKIYFDWPAAEDNSILKLARRRLLGSAKPGVLKGAATQQGMLQVLHDFCDHANALCENCQFPELVKDWAAKASTSVPSYE